MPALPPAPWGKPWFYPKSIGYGAGLPCSWEGWTTYGVYAGVNLALVATFSLLAGEHQPLGGAILFTGVALTTLPTAVLAWGRTAGGWHWRMGK